MKPFLEIRWRRQPRVWVAYVLVAIWGAGCARLPDNSQRTESFAFTDTADTPLGRTFADAAARHPGHSGLHPMPNGVDAFAARITLADLAQRSIDVQYYIWDPDPIGRLLIERLLAAADRGVRVRVLLDDYASTADDRGLLALDGHPNVEVRLFNPIALRSNKTLGLLFDSSRANRRMHNKSFNADNQVAIVGGRNIADEYFEVADDSNMADLDVVSVGPVVRDVGQSFDQYWNSPASFPITTLTHRTVSPEDFAAASAQLKADGDRTRKSPAGIAFAASSLVEQIRSGGLPSFYWGDATLVYDDPRKAAAQSDDPQHRLLPKVRSIIDNAKHEVVLVSPYFIPGRSGMEFFCALRRRGVRVVILTGAMASTDVLSVYAAYSRYREELLAMGVELYEFKPNAVHLVEGDQCGGKRAETASRASLHGKFFGFDHTSVFVGSLNLDPRSAKLNTEVGVIFQSPEMADQLWRRLDERLMEIAWKVEAVPMDSFGDYVRLNWVTRENGATVRLTDEPGQSFFRNLWVALVRILPIESQL